MVLVASFCPGLDMLSLHCQGSAPGSACYPAGLPLSEVSHLRGKAALFPTGCCF